jgi:hypothetical protein
MLWFTLQSDLGIQSVHYHALWKNPNSLAQGGYTQAHIYIYTFNKFAQLVYVVGSSQVDKDQVRHDSC